MTTTAIRAKLYDIIRNADDKKVEALYLILGGDEIVVGDEPQYDDWATDKNFVAELDDRLDKLNSGEDPGRTWSDIEASIEKLRNKHSEV